MKILCLIAVMVSFNAWSTTCDVKNYRDAIKCIQKDANQRYGEGELPHSVGATRTQKGKEDFELLTGKKSSTTYVGVAQVHYDEDQLLYYEIDKGENVELKLVKEFNMVDITYEVPDLEKLKEKEIEEILGLHIPQLETMADFHF